MSRFNLFIIGSIFVHILVGAFFIWNPSSLPVTLAQSDSKIVSLGLMTAIAGSISQQQVSAVTAPSSDAELQEKQPLPEKKAPIKASPKKQSVPKQKNESTDKEIVKNKESQIAKADTKIGALGQQGSTANDHKQLETGTGQQIGGAEINHQYDLEIRRHLLSFKTTPKRLSLRNIKGVVNLSFRIDRSGKVLQQEATVLQGKQGFRHEALAMLKSAEPFPKPPEKIDWQSREYQIDIKYQTQ
ncbi:TonB family protein [Shewanella sp. MM_2022_3]|uniref:energy transducer TonB n=1 Tax=Shewanella sp. MM_2022_3 TaxID=2923280 RepID=UPI001F4C1F77|nr:TonB family protein [Shewanella sp. MM_2022_3]MCH7425044.1 TonB family protein [Shewanella sp. MM_2022_3]